MKVEHHVWHTSRLGREMGRDRVTIDVTPRQKRLNGKQ